MTAATSVPKTLTWVFRTVAGIAIALLLIWFVDGVFALYRKRILDCCHQSSDWFWSLLEARTRAGIISLFDFLVLVVALERVRFWPSFLHTWAIAIFALLAFGFIWGDVIFSWRTRAKQRGTATPIQDMVMVLAVPGGIPRTLLDWVVTTLLRRLSLAR